MATATTTRDKQPKQLPTPNSDFYHYADIVRSDERAILQRVRTFMESKVAPIINKYWVEDAFPFELLPAVKELNLGGLGTQGYGCAGGGQLLVGLIGVAMAGRCLNRHFLRRPQLPVDGFDRGRWIGG